jgi:hypothetical protein
MDRPERKVAPSIASSPTVGVPFGVEYGWPHDPEALNAMVATHHGARADNTEARSLLAR